MTDFKFLNAFTPEVSSKWNNIIKAEEITKATINKINSILSPSSLSLFSSDLDLVVFGSIARNECTNNSDIDWTLLVDGQASPQHSEFSYVIKRGLEKTNLQKPGATGMFGQITFSHDLIHYIGGEDDTNHNLSRRILMLLESDVVLVNSNRLQTGSAYDRVIRGIISQYIENDSGYSRDRGVIAKIPRFLLNDVIRFWRTMCVDFAFKQKEQFGKKWALRNIKLRMSRKLIYLKGLLMCFSCYKNETLNIDNVKEHLYNLALMKPLDVLVEVLAKHDIDNRDIINLLDSYNDFLGILDDKDFREHLTNIEMLEVYKDPKHKEARQIAHRFQETLTSIFVVKESRLKDFTLKYGIF